MRSLYAEGKTYQEIADIFHVTRQRVHKIIGRPEWLSPRELSRTFINKQKILPLLDQMSYRDISMVTGVSLSAIMRYVRGRKRTRISFNPPKSGINKTAFEWENWFAEQCIMRGYETEQQPFNNPVFDVVVNGKTVDIKVCTIRSKSPSRNNRNTLYGWSIKYKTMRPSLYALIMGDVQKLFVIPATELPEFLSKTSGKIHITWPNAFCNSKYARFYEAWHLSGVY